MIASIVRTQSSEKKVYLECQLTRRGGKECGHGNCSLILLIQIVAICLFELEAIPKSCWEASERTAVIELTAE